VAEFAAALGQHAFLRYALIAGLLASVACGVVGSYVAARRITYIAGGISHCVLGGMGAARYAQVVWGWESVHPIHGAVVAALVAAAVIGWVSLRWKENEDTAISAVWSVGMAAGVLFIARTPGYSQDLMSYLFGNILMVGRAELWLIVGLDVAVVFTAVLLYRPLLAVCFDDEYARLRGMRVDAYYLLLLVLTALTVVLLVTVVGLVMVIALLTLPVAVARGLSRSLWQMMVVGAALSALFTTAGLAVGYQVDAPAGATTIMIAGATYALAVVGGQVARRLRRRGRSLGPGFEDDRLDQPERFGTDRA
jgi:zinc transport system permease protein